MPVQRSEAVSRAQIPEPCRSSWKRSEAKMGVSIILLGGTILGVLIIEASIFLGVHIRAPDFGNSQILLLTSSNAPGFSWFLLQAYSFLCRIPETITFAENTE